MSDLSKKIKDFIGGLEKGQFIGVDIGLSAVKVVLLSSSKKNTFKLEHFASVPLDEAAIIEDEVQRPEEVIEALVRAIEQAQIKSRICNLGMSGPNTVTKRLQVPDGSKEDIEDNVLWEAEQYISFGADESEVDYFIIKKIADDDVVDVIVAAAKTSVIEGFVGLLESAELKVKNVDLSIFALSNLFELVVQEELEHISEVGAIVIDFGAQSTTVMVYKDGAPVLTKEVAVGGVLITEQIQRQMGVSYEEAEDLKTNGDSQGNLPEEVVEIIRTQVNLQMEELRKVLNFFIAAGSSEQVAYCFVTGGASRSPGLMEVLEKVVGIEPQYLNPFDIIDYNKKKFDEATLEDIAITGAVAIGLGLRAN